MTVSANSRRREYDWNGVATVFDGPMAFEASHIRAFYRTADGVVSPLPEGNLTVTRLGRPASRVEVFGPAIPVGARLILLREMPYSQEVDIGNLGAFHAKSVEDADDAQVMQIQQLADGVARSFRLSDTADADIDFTMEAPTPGSLIGWDQDGRRLQTYSPEQFVTTATAGVPFTANVAAGQTDVPLVGLKTPWSPQGVFYNGIFQEPTAYTRTGAGIKFLEPLPVAGTVAVVAVFGGPTNVTDSDMLTYTRAAPGGTTRSVLEKLSDTVSVKDFGAKGDGVSDDTARLQLAINSGARELFWPPGHYVTSAALKPVNNQSWLTPAGQTMIKLAASAPTNTHVIAHNTNGLDGPLQNFSMSGFTVDGSAKEGGLVLYGCQRLRLTDCVFQNCETYGLGLQARPGSTIDEPQDDIVMTRCQFNYNGQNTVFDGLDVKYCTNTVLESCSATGNTDAGLNLRGSNLDLIGCQAVGNGTAGILLQSNDATADSYIRVVGGQAFGTTAGPGLELQGNAGNTTFIEVSAFQSYANTGGDGVRISGTGPVIGNISALQARDNAGHGVQITGPTGSLSFTGGLFAGNAGDGFRTSSAGAVLNGVALIGNTGAGYRETAGADNNYLLPTCVVSGNGTDMPARVGTETDAGFMSVRSKHSLRLFPGLASGVEMRTDTGGAHSTMAAVGTATNIDLRITTKGNGAISLWKGDTGQQLALFRQAGSATVNFPDFVASLTGTPVLIQAAGADTNIDLQLTPKGTGRVRFGALTANADAPITGYITIKDSGGTERKLAVIA